jgi:MFS family permease
VFLSAAGDLLAWITLALVVHDLTGSGLAVSAYFAATMLPVVALSPPAGVIADRFEPVRVMALASIAQATIAAGLVLTTDSYAAILVLVALMTAGSAISQPAEFALVPYLAADDELTRANGLMESARYAGFAAGPVLAGAVAAVGGAELALLVNAASFLAIAVAAALIRTRRGPARAAEAPAPGGAAHAAEAAGLPDRARDGLAYLWRDPVLRPTLLAAVGALAFISASMTLEVFYVKEVLGGGQVAYAALMLAWMLGMVAGAMRFAWRVPGNVIGAAALVALAVQGAGMGLQTVWPVLPLAIAGYAIGGAGHGVKNTLLRTLIQRRVPDRIHGRAFAAYNAARNTAEVAALAAGGLLVTAIGARAGLALAGLGPIVAAAAGLVVLRRSTRREPIRRTERFPLPPNDPLPEVN